MSIGGGIVAQHVLHDDADMLATFNSINPLYGAGLVSSGPQRPWHYAHYKALRLLGLMA